MLLHGGITHRVSPNDAERAEARSRGSDGGLAPLPTASPHEKGTGENPRHEAHPEETLSARKGRADLH